MIASFLFVTPAYAVLYSPGETLDPACAPTDAECGIQPQVGDGINGQIPYYATDGSVLTATSSITILSSGNVGIGTTTPSSNLTVAGAIDITDVYKLSGATILHASSTLGSLYIGEGAGNVTATGTANTAIGYQAGSALTSGAPDQANVFLGYRAGANLTTGRESTFIGYRAGESYVSNENPDPVHDGLNTFIGASAGLYTTGLGGVANNNGTNNVFVGQKAGVNNVNGSGNVYVGAHGGAGMVGSNNVAIGQTSGDGGAGGTILGDNNTALGAFTFNTGNGTRNDNVVIGKESGKSMTTADDNTYVGTESGENGTTGQRNTYLGRQTGQLNTTGNDNVFVGNFAGQKNTSSSNTAVGGYAGGNMTSGSYVALLGFRAGSQYTTGQRLTAVGSFAGYGLTTQNYNVMIGDQAGYNLASNNNVFVGSQAGDSATTGGSNIALGSLADIAAGVSNSIAIGTNVTVSTNNTVILGPDTITTTLLKGNIGVGSSTPNAKLSLTQSANSAAGGLWISETGNTDFRSVFMNTSGVLSFYGGDTAGTLNTATLNAAGEWTNASDVAYKEQIEDLPYGLDALNQLQPRAYIIKNTDDHRIGFIAQEVEEIIPEVVSGEDGSKGISYGNLVAVVVKALQELAAKVSGFAESFTSKHISTEELCLTDSEGMTCYTRAQLNTALGSNAGTSSANETELEPTNTSAPETNSNNEETEGITATSTDETLDEDTANTTPETSEDEPDENTEEEIQTDEPAQIEEIPEEQLTEEEQEDSVAEPTTPSVESVPNEEE